MWVSDKLLDFFKISQIAFDGLHTELASACMERDLLRTELTKAQITSDWLRIKVNQLEYQNTALLEKAYGIKLPTPEITRQPIVDPAFDPTNFSFEDVGDSMAKKLGLPSYS